mmetsp:Transcript_81104/g.262719  ORF Transcript_81104/g.262719 Transcript_81104/m.262719 type:complete len:236 (+) Transcript_81104:771-1478(+)
MSCERHRDLQIVMHTQHAEDTEHAARGANVLHVATPTRQWAALCGIRGSTEPVCAREAASSRFSARRARSRTEAPGCRCSMAGWEAQGIGSACSRGRCQCTTEAQKALNEGQRPAPDRLQTLLAGRVLRTVTGFRGCHSLVEGGVAKSTFEDPREEAPDTSRGIARSTCTAATAAGASAGPRLRSRCRSRRCRCPCTSIAARSSRRCCDRSLCVCARGLLQHRLSDHNCRQPRWT